MSEVVKHPQIIIICLEGVPAAGKSEISKKLAKYGSIIIMSEGFIEKSTSKLHSQGPIRELQWWAQWFLRLGSLIQKNPGVRIIVTDRSPRTPPLYVRWIRMASNSGKKIIGECGKELKNVFDEFVKYAVDEFCVTYNAVIKFIHVTVDKEILDPRRNKRLKKEPFRKEYGEGNQKMMDQIKKVYEKEEWDIKITNNQPNDGYFILSHLIQHCISDMTSFNLIKYVCMNKKGDELHVFSEDEETNCNKVLKLPNDVVQWELEKNGEVSFQIPKSKSVVKVLNGLKNVNNDVFFNKNLPFVPDPNYHPYSGNQLNIALGRTKPNKLTKKGDVGFQRIPDPRKLKKEFIKK